MIQVPVTFKSRVAVVSAGRVGTDVVWQMPVGMLRPLKLESNTVTNRAGAARESVVLDSYYTSQLNICQLKVLTNPAHIPGTPEFEFSLDQFEEFRLSCGHFKETFVIDASSYAGINRSIDAEVTGDVPLARTGGSHLLFESTINFRTPN